MRSLTAGSNTEVTSFKKLVLLDGIGRLDSDLVLGGITVLNGEVVVLQANVNIGSDVLYRKVR